jgi:transcription antitermination factor NusG
VNFFPRGVKRITQVFFFVLPFIFWIALKIKGKKNNGTFVTKPLDVKSKKECSICGKMFVASDGRQTTCTACRKMDAMRATYRREPDAMHLLKKENLGCFIPMQYKICIKKGKKVRALVPVVHNLLFVHARPSDVQRVKSQVTYLQYITDTRSGQKIIVPDGQMQRFIAVSGTYDDHLLYFQPDELNLSKGTKVRITGGEFEGQEGIFLKVKGARDRRVVIEIQGVIAVAMATIHPDLIEVIG